MNIIPPIKINVNSFRKVQHISDMRYSPSVQSFKLTGVSNASNAQVLTESRIKTVHNLQFCTILINELHQHYVLIFD
jgi:hypothetical protein